jgi:hypothetical protein
MNDTNQTSAEQAIQDQLRRLKWMIPDAIVACKTGDSSQIRWSLGSFGGAQNRLYKKTPEGDADLETTKDGTFPGADWKPVKVDMADGKLRYYYDDILIHEVKIADIVAAIPPER